jgi:hypothetical protein
MNPSSEFQPIDIQIAIAGMVAVGLELLVIQNPGVHRGMLETFGDTGASMIFSFFVVCTIAVPVVLIRWNRLKRRIGTIHCRRCSYIGPPTGKFRFGKGLQPVCPKCQVEDWESASNGQ